jgi:hypothetical protein
VTDGPADAAVGGGNVPPDAIVVRGGDPCDTGQLERMLEQARVSYEEGEGFALSTFAGHDASKSRDELVADVASTCRMPQRRLAVTTARRIVEAGFRLVPDGELPGHVNIDLGTELTDEVVKRFIDLFDPAEENPTYPEFRKGR